MFGSRKITKLFISILLIVGILFGACAIYVSIYYKADENAVEAALLGDTSTVEENDSFTSFIPKGEIKAGFIFYPGGKVEHKAYYPLMKSLAEYGILSTVVEMPFRLAVLDVDAANSVKQHYQDISSWYIGGHSLGGSMAASHLAKNESDYKGLILLGSYSTSDLSASSTPVLSIYGSCDGVMNREKYSDSLSNMPNDFTEIVIEGGNHAYFGAYGEQKGDGAATLSPEEQASITASHIYAFINSHG